MGLERVTNNNNNNNYFLKSVMVSYKGRNKKKSKYRGIFIRIRDIFIIF